MCIIPEIHALSTAFFIFDFTVNKNPLYVTQTENIRHNTSEVVFLHLSLNIHHIEKVSMQYVLYTIRLR